MNLKQLKGMIAEEYRYWLAEQPIDGPGIEVGPNDIDAMGGGEDSEDTLRQIYDMLKAYFEGGAGAEMPAGGADMDIDMDMDMDADDSDDKDDDVSEEKDDEKDKKESKKDKEDLKERFKKLANIVKG